MASGLGSVVKSPLTSVIFHRIHGAAIYGNMDPINIPQMLAYIYIYIYQHHGSYGYYYVFLFRDTQNGGHSKHNFGPRII